MLAVAVGQGQLQRESHAKFALRELFYVHDLGHISQFMGSCDEL